jgi:chaperonin GroES
VAKAKKKSKTASSNKKSASSKKSKPQKSASAKSKKPLKASAKSASSKSAAKRTSPSKTMALSKKLASSPKKTAASKALKKMTSSARSALAEISPLKSRVVILRDGEADRTPGGLFIPQMVQDKPLRGTVIAAGKGKFSKKGTLQPLDVKAGDKVLFSRYAGSEIKLQGQELLIVEESEILGIIQD